jgi:polysaccharide biosynthesis transport protein
MVDIVKKQTAISHSDAATDDVRSSGATDIQSNLSPRPKRLPERRHLRDYWNVILKRQWLVLATVATIFVVTAIETFTMTPHYRAVTRLKVDPESSSVLPYKEIHDSGTGYWDAETYLQTQWAILQSRALAERVVRSLGPEKQRAFRESTGQGFLRDKIYSLMSAASGAERRERDQARTGVHEHAVLSPSDGGKNTTLSMDRLLKGLQVEAVRNTRLVNVFYTCSDPQLAADVVNTVAEEFIELNFEDKYQATIRATDFLERQLQDLKVTVEKSEERLVEYARAHNILSLADQQDIVIQRLGDLNQEMTKVESEMMVRRAEYERVRQASVLNFPPSLITEKISQLELSEVELKRKLRSLGSRYGGRWPEFQQIQEELRQVNEELGREKEQALRHAQENYAVAIGRQQQLAATLERQKDLADQLSQDSIQYNILRREVETNKELYEGLLQRLKEAGVSAGLKSSNISVVDRGEVPLKVFSPHKASNLFFGLAFALVVGISLAFFLDYLDNTLKTPEEVDKKLALPSLGVIPRFERAGSIRVRTLLGRQNGEAPRVKSHLPSPHSFRNQYWEAYRGLRTSILLSTSGKPPKIVMFTSALAGEGKTATAVNTGIIFAQSGIRTLLIDLDMRRPSVGEYFEANNSRGMSYHLTGNCDLASEIRETEIENLFLLTAGQTPPNPAELLSSRLMDKALLLARNSFDHVIIDTAPVLSVTDALVLSPKVDGVVMVIRAGKTASDAVRRATEHLEQVGARILGVVINDADLRNGHYRYYYKYYYDNRYYADKA